MRRWASARPGTLLTSTASDQRARVIGGVDEIAQRLRDAGAQAFRVTHLLVGRACRPAPRWPPLRWPARPPARRRRGAARAGSRRAPAPACGIRLALPLRVARRRRGQRRQLAGAKRGIERLQSLFDRRMRGEEARQARGKQHVRHFFGFGRHQLRAGADAGDLEQRAAEPGRIARELHRGGVRQPLAMP